MTRFDSFFEKVSRGIAHRTSRRAALTRLGRFALGAALALPVLPFDRTARAAGHGGAGKRGSHDDTSCEYWRYCAIDGYLCTCCGGTINSCPPGTEPSKVAWIGTCHNPKDGKDYLISYNDCCGGTPCGRCACNNNIGDKPGYRMGEHNDVNWCMAHTSSTSYHCTVVVSMGVAQAR
ncbi:MAG: amine dehydrogenase [Cupriavidus sp.]|nr:amine dehydrogenase [Cupriavidus sp.]NUT16665.1 amine dehydrogenase [Cupriavidus sp.]